jgi:hypothetical protein
MLQVENKSPFAVAISVLPNCAGVDTLYVNIKGTFSLVPALAVAETQSPVVLADEHWGDPAISSLKYASELHLGKPGTDVVLVGQAWAPARRPVSEGGVMVRVSDRQKVIRVTGDRVWQGRNPSKPKPFESIPLVFERAYGGTHVRAGNQSVLSEERNPVGVGFVGKRSRDEMAGLPVPNLEELRSPIQSLGDVAPPACFGFVAPAWLPRRQYAGTYDKAWQSKRAPYLPQDFDPRFFHAAAPELTFTHPLVGGEPVYVAGATPDAPVTFHLPRCRFDARVALGGGNETLTPKLETVLIEPDDNRVCLTWRAELSCDKKVLGIKTVRVSVVELAIEKEGKP